LKARTVNQLIKEYCEEKQYGEEIEDMLSLYWSHTRKLMVKKEDPYIFLVGLGEFSINRKKLTKKIAQTYAYIDQLDKKDYTGIAKYTDLQLRLKTYKDLLSKSYDVVNAKKEFKQKHSDKQDQNNLEE
jgi:hypothetical protein